MSFVRPEALHALTRWREVLFGAGVVLAGLWLFNLGGPFYALLGALVVAVGAGLAIVALRRLRFPAGQGGPGVVEVDERRITYFSVLGGRDMSIDALERVEIRTTGNGPAETDLFWLFHALGEPPLIIPGDAAGVGALFDVLSALPGADFDRVTAASGSTRDETFVIWQAGRKQLH